MDWRTRERIRTVGIVGGVVVGLGLWAFALFLLYHAMKPI